MSQEILSQKFSASLMNVRSALEDIWRHPAMPRLNADVSGSLELVLAEVLDNIVEHAYPEGQEGPIEVSMHTRGEDIECRVKDFGRAMPNEALPAGIAPDIPEELDCLPEGGFGWFLIGELAKDLTYTRRDSTNLFSFRMPAGLPIAANQTN